MKRIAISIFMIFFLFKVHCQPVVTDASNKRIMEWDSSYVVESKSFRADSLYEITYQYIVRKHDKIIAEYFRHDDTSYLHVRYDTLGILKERGLLKYTNEIFECEKISIPDLLRDPEFKKEILKDTVFCNGSYRKNGIWKEIDSTGLIFKGEYRNGLREGDWKEGFLLRDQHNIGMARMNDYFRPYITSHFNRGVEIPLYSSKDWLKIIKHNWFYNYY